MYRSGFLTDDHHQQNSAHQQHVSTAAGRHDDSNNNDAASTSSGDSTLPPPPPPPRSNADVPQSPFQGPWVRFESRNVSWTSTIDNTSSSGSDGEEEESFDDNESPTGVSSPVFITANPDGSGWEVQPTPTPSQTPVTVHADHAAQIISDRVRRMVQRHDDRMHQKQAQRAQKKHRDEALRQKQLSVEDDDAFVDDEADDARRNTCSWPSSKTCLLSAIVIIFLICGALGIALVVTSRRNDVNNSSNFPSFGELDIGHSGPPLDDSYGGPSTAEDADLYDGDSNIIDEVGEEGYYNDEDDDGIPDDYDGFNSGDGYDEEDEEGGSTMAPSKAPTTPSPSRRPTKSLTTVSVSELVVTPIIPPTSPRPTPIPIRRPTTRRPTKAPTSVPSMNNGIVSPHNKYSVPDKYRTELDGHILVPERQRNTLFLFNGGKQPADRQWDESNALWSLRLYPRHLWQRSNSINDVKRVVHNGRIHIAVCGSGGDAVALYDFETKAAVYWSNTCGSAPHDVEYLPFGKGYMAVASSRGRFSTINLYDIGGGNNQECIRGAEVRHNGVHSLQWDAKQNLLWAWGSDTIGLVSYRVRFGGDGSPRLIKHQVFQPDILNFKVATGHGGSPMIANGRRYLLLAGDSGILRFDTESHEWRVERSAPDGLGVYSNPKGIDYKQDGSGEIIMAKSNSRVYSTQTGQRQILEADIYKARWWQHNAFSYDPENDSGSGNVAALRPVQKPAPKPATESFFSSDYLVGAYYFVRSGFGQQFLRNQLQPSQTPVLGDYDGTKPNVIAQHLAWSREANVNLWVTGWKGPNSNEDQTIREGIMKHPNLPGTKIALLYQTNTRIDLSGDSGLDVIYRDVEFIARNYFNNPNYLRIDGRPVFYLYLSRVLHRNYVLEQVVDLIRQAAADNGRHDVYIIGDQAFGDAPRPGTYFSPFELLDSVTNYDVYGDIRRVGYAGQDGVLEYANKQKRWQDAALASANCDFIPSITPGFNDGPRHSPLSRQVHGSADPGSLFRRLLDGALDLADSSRSRMVMITSWNGFHDDTQIEPVLEGPVTRQATDGYNQMQLNYQGYGKLYLNIIRQTILKKKRSTGQRR